MTAIEEKRAAIIANAIEGREEEVMLYDINIENYTKALELIDVNHPGDGAIDEAMQKHKATLTKLLHTEMLERAKSQLILDALRR